MRGRAFGSDWSGWKQALLGGFQMQGIFQYQAGRPLTLANVYYNGNLSDLKPVIKSSTIGALGNTNIEDNVFRTNIQTTGFYFSDDTVRTNGQLDYSKQRSDKRINLSQNIRTLPSRVSNFRNQPITLLDLSVIKNFSFGERVYLQFRAEAINALNKPHFSGPVLNPRDANFGRVARQAYEPLHPGGAAQRLQWDARLLRELALREGLAPDADVAAEDIAGLLDTLSRRVLIAIHTYIPDDAEVEGWMERLIALHEAAKAYWAGLGGAFRAARAGQDGRFDGGEPWIRAAAALRHGPLDAAAVGRALAGEPRSAYARALARAHAGIAGL